MTKVTPLLFLLSATLFTCQRTEQRIDRRAWVTRHNPVLNALGDFKRDALNVAVLGKNQPGSQKIYDRVAWK